MNGMNEIIVDNIITQIQKSGKKQVELAQCLGVSRQTISKMLSGERMINAVELALIAEALNVTVDTLVKLPSEETGVNTVRAFMGKVDTPQAKEGLEIAEKLAELICFHSECMKNGESLNISWGKKDEQHS